MHTILFQLHSMITKCKHSHLDLPTVCYADIGSGCYYFEQKGCSTKGETSFFDWCEVMTELFTALNDELEDVLRLVDGFLGQMNVVHNMSLLEAAEINGMIDSLRFRYKQLQSLITHKALKDNDKIMDSECAR